ncbi:MAG: hypothetical protein HYT72_01610 [Candidatus Aenigmarchaeota archaeon]|nr:hypothetical protein [Candidatus Aenigmarchaeota archaeon]
MVSIDVIRTTPVADRIPTAIKYLSGPYGEQLSPYGLAYYLKEMQVDMGDTPIARGLRRLQESVEMSGNDGDPITPYGVVLSLEDLRKRHPVIA